MKRTTSQSCVELTAGERQLLPRSWDPGAVATLAVLIAAVMLVLGLLRLGSVMSFVSTAVMTGFTRWDRVAAATGVLKDATGYSPQSDDTLGKLVNSVVHITRWDVTAMRIAIGIVLAWALIRLVHARVARNPARPGGGHRRRRSRT